MGEVTKALSDMRVLIERGWSQHLAARDLLGNTVEPRDKAAVRWCLHGACMAVVGDIVVTNEDWARYWRPLVAAAEEAGFPVHGWAPHAGPVRFNDAPGRTQAEVIALMDRAIALAEADEVSRG
jgi:hypothetical protein